MFLHWTWVMAVLSPSEWSTCSIILFCQAEDGIRDLIVTGVQTCALPISAGVGIAAEIARASPRRRQGNEQARAAAQVESVAHEAPFTRRRVDGKLRLRSTFGWDRARACRRRPPPTTERSSTSLGAVASFPSLPE